MYSNCKNKTIKLNAKMFIKLVNLAQNIMHIFPSAIAAQVHKEF